MRVAIIGAGIVGASVAFRLSRGGARVWLLDEYEPASGTTSASFAWLNANNKTPRKYFELNRAGMEEHRRLADEWPDGAPWLHRGGNLIWAEEGEDLEELERRVERLRSWDYAAEWWTASRLTAELEPNAAFQKPETPVAFFPDEGWVDAPELTKNLVEQARRDGAELHSSAAVQAIENEGSAFRLRLSDENVVTADAVVNAAGPGSVRVAAMLGRALPVASKKGLLARVRVEGEPLGRLLHTPRVNLRPDGPGHVLLHHGSVDEAFGEAPEAAHGQELLGRAREVLPALERAEVSEVRLGVRPVPEDGVSCVGAVSGIPGYYEAVTHSGVTLGLLVGRLLAREILTGEIDPLAAPFRPDRFASSPR